MSDYINFLKGKLVNNNIESELYIFLILYIFVYHHYHQLIQSIQYLVLIRSSPLIHSQLSSHINHHISFHLIQQSSIIHHYHHRSSSPYNHTSILPSILFCFDIITGATSIVTLTTQTHTLLMRSQMFHFPSPIVIHLLHHPLIQLHPSLIDASSYQSFFQQRKRRLRTE